MKPKTNPDETPEQRIVRMYDKSTDWIDCETEKCNEVLLELLNYGNETIIDDIQAIKRQTAEDIFKDLEAGRDSCSDKICSCCNYDKVKIKKIKQKYLQNPQENSKTIEGADNREQDSGARMSRPDVCECGHEEGEHWKEHSIYSTCGSCVRCQKFKKKEGKK